MLRVRSTAVIGALAGASVALVTPQAASAAVHGDHAKPRTSKANPPPPIFIGRLVPAGAADCQLNPGGPGGPGGPGNPPPPPPPPPPPSQGGGGAGGGGGGGGGGAGLSAALNQLNRALNQGNQATSFSISANTQSLMVGPAAAFGDYGSVVTIDLSKHPLEEMELVGLVKDCLLNFCSGEITTKLFETLHIVPSSSETPVAYRFVSSGLQFPTIIDLLVRPRAAGGDK